MLEDQDVTSLRPYKLSIWFLHKAWRGQLPPQLHQTALDGTPQRVLSTLLHSFFDSSRGGIPFHPASLPVLGLSEGDKQCIRDCSSIMARHLFADKSGELIHAQVNALLSSLDIDSNVHDKGPMPEKFRELDDYWNKSQGNVIQDAHAAILDEKKTRSVL
ncbi:hypothetical protein RYX36_011604 [Vicia faba]